jgi:hypothetical protein
MTFFLICGGGEYSGIRTQDVSIRQFPGNPGPEDLDLWGERNFLVRILISRWFESVNTVFGADFVFRGKNSSSLTTEGK